MSVRGLLRAVAVALLLAVSAPAAADAATRAERIVSLARAELRKGVKEIPDGSNKAPAIRRYVRSTSPSWFGAPWCAYFVSYIAKRAGVPIGPAGRGLGYVPTIVSWAKRTKRWRKTPRPGYLVTWPNHVGIVEKVSRSGTMTTIEGNSANRVRRRWRRTSDAQGFVALAKGGKLSPSVPKPKRPSKKGEGRLRARITAYPSSRLHVGDRLELSANDSSGPVEKVRWDLDADGRFDDAKGDTATMRVVRSGTFRVAVRVSSRSGRSAVARSTITVLGRRAPTAVLKVPAETHAGEKITVDASRSKDPLGKGLEYEWDLEGDGTFLPGTAKGPITYATPGVRAVTVRIRDAAGVVDEETAHVSVGASLDPVVRVGCAAPSVHTGEKLFCAADHSTSGRRITRVEWDTDGDGRYARKSIHERFTWSRPGVYEVRVRVTDSKGEKATASTWVEALNRSPAAALSAPAAIHVDQTFTVDASKSADPDGSVARIRWDVGGEGAWDGEGQKLTIRPQAVGPLRVIVEVTDDRGAVTLREAWVEVRPPLTAVAGVLTADPVAGSPVQLTARDSSGGTLRKCMWDLDGDGDVDKTRWNCADPFSVTYKSPGTRTLRLTVEATDGRRATTTATLVVR